MTCVLDRILKVLDRVLKVLEVLERILKVLDRILKVLKDLGGWCPRLPEAGPIEKACKTIGFACFFNGFSLFCLPVAGLKPD